MGRAPGRGADSIKGRAEGSRYARVPGRLSPSPAITLMKRRNDSRPWSIMTAP